jgi:hypothetical protein
MHAAEKTAATSGSLPYEVQMSNLRDKLAGRPYCKKVRELLPEVTKATIHGAVAGRNQNDLVLAALKIVVAKMEIDEKAKESRLCQLQEQLSELELAA